MLVQACEQALGEASIERSGEQKVLVACSGGRDSMALLRVTTIVLGVQRVVAGHVDHGVRPGSQQQAAELATFCHTQGITFSLERLNPSSDDEATLRALRYEALERMRVGSGSALILMGHTRDDQAETVLIGLCRTGTRASLAGMPARRGHILRPWLDRPRDEVHAYLEKKRWPYWEDNSNGEPRYLRNRVRKELLPLLERRYGRSVSKRLAGLARECSFPVRQQRFEPKNEIAASEVANERKKVRKVLVPKEFSWIESGISVQQLKVTGLLDFDNPNKVYFDANVVVAPRIRMYRAGDRVHPWAWSSGRRRISDLLGESGVPVELRVRFPVVVDSEDEVLWVPGLLRSKQGPVVDTTSKVWMFSIEDNH